MNISGLLEKLMRRETLSVDEAAEAMGAIMSGEATPAQIGALLVGLTMKGERPAEIVGLARTMRANAVQLSRTFEDVFDTCGTGGDRSGTFNISSAAALVAAAAGSARGEARQPFGLEPVRQRRRVRGAGRQCGGGAGSRRAIASSRSASRSSLRRRFIRRCGTPLRFDASLAVRTAFNLLGPLTNPAGTRRQLVGVPHSELTELIARVAADAGLRSRVGRARGRRHRRDVDDRSHQGVRVPERRGVDVLRAPVRLRPSEGRAHGSAGRRRRRQRRDSSRRVRRRARDRAATSCCSTPAHRCSSAERRHRCAKVSSAPRRPSIRALPARSSTR